jgi:hypothetical protein
MTTAEIIVIALLGGAALYCIFMSGFHFGKVAGRREMYDEMDTSPCDY